MFQLPDLPGFVDLAGLAVTIFTAWRRQRHCPADCTCRQMPPRQ